MKFLAFIEKNKDLLKEFEKRLVWFKLVINRIILGDALRIGFMEIKVEVGRVVGGYRNNLD